MQSLQDLRQAVHAGDLTKEAAEAILQATVDHLREAAGILSKVPSSFVKTANMGGKVLAAVLSSAGLALGGLAINKIYQGYEKGKTEQAHEKAFQEMYRVRPEIRNIPEEKVKEYFSIFADLSPDLAKNPFIAANFVERQAAGFGGVGFEEAGQLARTQEQIKRNQGIPLAETFSNEMIRQGIGAAGAGGQYAARHMMESMLSKEPEELGSDLGRHDMARYQTIRDRATALTRKDPELGQEMLAALTNASGKTKGLLTASERHHLEETLERVNPAITQSRLGNVQGIGNLLNNALAARAKTVQSDEETRLMGEWRNINPLEDPYAAENKGSLEAIRAAASRAGNDAHAQLAMEMIQGVGKRW